MSKKIKDEPGTGLAGLPTDGEPAAETSPEEPGEPGAAVEETTEEVVEEEPGEPGAAVEETTEEVVEEEPVVLIPVSQVKSGRTFEYGGSKYRVASNRIMIEDIETGGRGEIDPVTLVQEV